MEIKKKVKCMHCNGVVEHSGSCNCGSIVMVEGVVNGAYAGKDYIDISPRLLNEAV